jgi:hypothetical protein
LKQTEERIEKLHMILDKEKDEKKEIQLENVRLTENQCGFFRQLVILCLRNVFFKDFHYIYFKMRTTENLCKKM